jgi:hypothetical protein
MSGGAVAGGEVVGGTVVVAGTVVMAISGATVVVVFFEGGGLPQGEGGRDPVFGMAGFDPSGGGVVEETVEGGSRVRPTTFGGTPHAPRWVSTHAVSCP